MDHTRRDHLHATRPEDPTTRVGRLPLERTEAKLAELVLDVVVACAMIAVGWGVVGDRPLARQAVTWFAILVMLGLIWLGLHLRGQTWGCFGLAFQFPGWRKLFRMFLQSLLVLGGALVAFVAGGIIGPALGRAAEGADMTGYSYLQGNLPMLLVALAAVYVVSSFGEEVVYRGF